MQNLTRGGSKLLATALRKQSHKYLLVLSWICLAFAITFGAFGIIGLTDTAHSQWDHLSAQFAIFSMCSLYLKLLYDTYSLIGKLAGDKTRSGIPCSVSADRLV